MQTVSKKIASYIRPRADYLWGVPVFVEENTNSAGILLLTQGKKITQLLEIIRIGPEVKDISVGDTVILDSKGGGEVITLLDDEGQSFKAYVIKEASAIAVLEE